MTAEQRKEFVSRCPKKVYKYNDQKDIVEIEKMSECTLCIECSRYTDKLKLERARSRKTQRFKERRNLSISICKLPFTTTLKAAT